MSVRLVRKCYSLAKIFESTYSSANRQLLPKLQCCLFTKKLPKTLKNWAYTIMLTNIPILEFVGMFFVLKIMK